MRGVFRSEPDPLAIVPSLNATRSPVGAKVPGDISQFKCAVFLGRDRISRRYLLVWTRGVFRSETKIPDNNFQFECEVFVGQNKKIPGAVFQFECEVFVSQNQNPWRRSPVWMRCAFRSGPKCLALFPSCNARRFSARAEIPGDIPQFKCGAFFSQNRNSWRRFPV